MEEQRKEEVNEQKKDVVQDEGQDEGQEGKRKEEEDLMKMCIITNMLSQ